MNISGAVHYSKNPQDLAVSTFGLRGFSILFTFDRFEWLPLLGIPLPESSRDAIIRTAGPGVVHNMGEWRDEASKTFTLHEVATVGLSKAVRAKRARTQFTSVSGLPPPKRQAAPVCGGQAAILDEEREVRGGEERRSVSDDLRAEATDAVADVNAADWIAEEEPDYAEDDGLEFEWEDAAYEYEDDGMVRRRFEIQKHVRSRAMLDQMDAVSSTDDLQ